MKTSGLALAAAASVLFLSFCGLAEGPRAKLNHTAFNFNEGLRWGRYSEVTPRVDPKARDHFAKMHEGWGEVIRIESAEILQVEFDDGTDNARVAVKFTWYRVDGMELKTTQTIQHWEYRNGEWMLIAEEYQSGEPF